MGNDPDVMAKCERETWERRTPMPSDHTKWNSWPAVKPEQGRDLTIIFLDGTEHSGYRYGGGVVFFMPPDHAMYTYATPKFWRYANAE